jgi:hypothetical protein
MHWISHRGNLTGSDLSLENDPKQIELVINLGFECEIDVWVNQRRNKIYLGHDKPVHEIKIDWLEYLSNSLWIHCKNYEAIDRFIGTDLNYFYHSTDDYTITSKGYIWAYPGKCSSAQFIEVLPEISKDSNKSNLEILSQTGVCSDFIQIYKI